MQHPNANRTIIDDLSRCHASILYFVKGKNGAYCQDTFGFQNFGLFFENILLSKWNDNVSIIALQMDAKKKKSRFI